ncbi:response regulator [Flavobacterium sp.]|uniref:response regulator n=1 Tax=Flavobacterium sp. TaxID=239 RepID=UPI0026274AA7|nr:response regulator [Flavobacterium sp.]
MSGQFRRNLITGFGISILILIISSAASFMSIRKLLHSNEMVNHTQEIIYNLNEGSSVLVDAQTSMRGYLITNKKDFLTQYNDAEARADDYFDRVELLTSDNPEQQQYLEKLKPLRNEFFNYLKVKVNEKTHGKAITDTDLNEGRRIMGDIRNLLKQIESNEQELLAQRNETSQRFGTYSTILIIAAAIIAILISIFFFTRIIKDYNERLKLQAELERKDRETEERIRVISKIAEQVAAGNYDVRVNDSEKDALGTVALSLNNMAGALSTSFNSLADNEWLQAGVAQLNEVMLGEKGVEQLAADVIEYLAIYTGSNAGVIYLLEGEELLLTAGYSYIADDKRKSIRLGEGLTGQSVVSGKMLQVTSASPENVTISYALGEIKPGNIIALPLMDRRVAGALELAKIDAFTPLEAEFLNAVANNIAIAITAAQNRKRVQELLEETQAQSEELRVQHTELESMNAELETQTEKLQASEEELRVQQEELQQTNQELEERSVLLEERNLEIQKKTEDLELSTRYKSEFLANMSHELRTPLNSILLLSRLLSENGEANMTDEQVEFAKVIQSSGNGLLGLIDEILDLSKIEAGKMDLEFMDISVKEVTDNLKNLFTEVAREKNIEFKIDAENAPLVIRTDKMRLEQILKNLISNAIKFTAEGSVTLKIKKTEDGKHVDFAVIDTGIGIPPEKQPLIFEAFQQADGSTKRKYGGTGLGLSISRELSKLLGGEISLSSKVNQGSTFALTIPVIGQAGANLTIEREKTAALPSKENKVDETAKAEKKAEVNRYISNTIPDDVPDDKDIINEGDKVILIVEDDVNFAKALLDFSHQRGYKGVVSVRGDQALNLALIFKPVGILLDIQLPIMSGWEVMEALKANTETKHIPVHIMSSHKVRKESLLKGAVNFLDKPVAFEQMPDIFTRIEHIINRESQKVLIFEDNPKHAQALAYFLGSNNINSEIKSEITDGVSALQQENVDCVILDMGVPDNQAYEILENIKKNPGLENLPVIVFTGKSLSMKEELKIKKYADSIVIKTAHSYQRMLDEVSLFLHLVEQSKNADKKEGNRKAGILANVLNGKTVLVVDDDVRNIYSLTKALETLKMNVITAIDGKEALKALDENPEVDVVLLDMMMPNMDGYETATRIRQDRRFKNLPVIAVTAKAMTGDREKCINAGASDYITKPVDVDQLLSLLRVWLYDRV